MSIELETRSLAETDALACHIARAVNEPMTIALVGTLGAGKTRLVQGLVAALSSEPIEVTSPTFTLWHTYPTKPLLHHLDAYRIESEDEFWELGVEELFSGTGIVVVEWADKFPEVLPEDCLWVEVDVVDPTTRRWSIRAHRPLGRACLRALRREISESDSSHNSAS